MQKEKKALRIMLLITTPKLADRAAALCAEARIPVHYQFPAHGTASSEIRDLLGIGTTEKDVVFTLAPQQKLRRVLPDLSSHLHLAKAGHGIAFAVELDSINASALNSLTRFMPEEAIKEESPMNKEHTHEVILTVLDGDQTDLAFAAAKEAGCRGGTVIKGRRVSGGQARKIFSLIVQPEKELLMILVPAKDCKAIRKAMVNKVQQETGERIVVFALPVSDVMGLTNYDLMNDSEEEA